MLKWRTIHEFFSECCVHHFLKKCQKFTQPKISMQAFFPSNLNCCWLLVQVVLKWRTIHQLLCRALHEPMVKKCKKNVPPKVRMQAFLPLNPNCCWSLRIFWSRFHDNSITPAWERSDTYFFCQKHVFLRSTKICSKVCLSVYNHAELFQMPENDDAAPPLPRGGNHVDGLPPAFNSEMLA